MQRFGEGGVCGGYIGLGQVEEKSSEGFSHGLEGNKCSGEWEQVRRDGEASRTGLGRGWG